jgi:hypothetical protein
MSFFDDVWDTSKRVAVGVSTGGISEVVRAGKKSKWEEEQEAAANAGNVNAERKSLLEEGLQRGQTKGETLYGQTQEETGADIRSIIGRRREMVGQPSRAESAIRAQGQNTARKARSAGGSDAQQRQIELESAQRAGIQGDVDRERRLQDFQSLMGNIASNKSALEAGWGQAMLASQYIAPEQRDQGILGDFFQGLGL